MEKRLQVNFDGKIMTGIGTIPFIIVGLLFGSMIPDIPNVITAFVTFFVGTLLYQKYVARAEPQARLSRFVLFTTAPVVFSVGIMLL